MANQGIIEVEGLPEHPLDAAAHFHTVFVPRVRSMATTGGVVVILPHADHTHSAWRLAAVQELAREAVPNRVNAVEGEEEAAVSDTLFYLQSADGVTGQVFTLA
ncbi:MAG: hypothetical protein JY451_01475 [Erythrobacter sp.]|nr:MAG: hypothetical protein JY451_01475 [Erythrobacter sp.]